MSDHPAVTRRSVETTFWTNSYSCATSRLERAGRSVRLIGFSTAARLQRIPSRRAAGDEAARSAPYSCGSADCLTHFLSASLSDTLLDANAMRSVGERVEGSLEIRKPLGQTSNLNLSPNTSRQSFSTAPL